MRSSVCICLGALASSHTYITGQIIPPLVKLLKDPKVPRRVTCRTLCKCGGAGIDCLVEILRESKVVWDSKIKIEVVRALSNNTGNQAKLVLNELARLARFYFFYLIYFF